MAEKRLLDLCAMQLKLDASIQEKKKPELSKEALFDNTLVALDVELAEFANEGRWFKFWSEDQQPRIEVYSWIENGEIVKTLEDPRPNPHPKKYYNGFGITNPLLEEYVDCLHFFLSAANQKGWRHDLMLIQGRGVKGPNTVPFVINQTFLLLKSHLANLYLRRELTHFKAAWESFLILGIRIYGFTWDEIEAAYRAKNEVNHERQQSGY